MSVTPSLLAGFDAIIEISREVLLRLIARDVQIFGTSLNPPFEIWLPISSGTVPGSLYLLVHNLQLELNADDTLSLKFVFDNSSIVVNSPFSRTASPLDGNTTITIPVPTEPVQLPGTNLFAPAANFRAATVLTDFSPSARAVINNALQGTGITFDQFRTELDRQLTIFVQNLGFRTFQFGFNVLPSVDGLFSDEGIRFERLEVHNIIGPDDSQALALFGILFVSHDSQGNHSDRNFTNAGARNNFSFTISAEALHHFMFCPSVVCALDNTPDRRLCNDPDPSLPSRVLPPSCGTSARFPFPAYNADLTFISDNLANGYMNFDGRFTGSGTGYSFTGSFHLEITIDVESVYGTRRLVARIQKNESSLDVDMDWWVWLLGGLAG